MTFCGHTWFFREAARPGNPVYSFRLASETKGLVVRAQYPRHRNILAYVWHRPWNNTAELPRMHCIPQIKERQLRFRRDVLVVYRFLSGEAEVLLDLSTLGMSFAPLNDRWQLHVHACCRSCPGLEYGAQSSSPDQVQ